MCRDIELLVRRALAAHREPEMPRLKRLTCKVQKFSPEFREALSMREPTEDERASAEQWMREGR